VSPMAARTPTRHRVLSKGRIEARVGLLGVRGLERRRRRILQEERPAALDVGWAYRSAAGRAGRLHPTPPHLAERILTSPGALDGERKQVTVLFADVVGFRTLTERLDPEAVHAIMDGCFDVLTRCVHRYEGSTNERGH